MKAPKQFLSGLAGRFPAFFPLPEKGRMPILPFYHAVAERPSRLLDRVLDVPTPEAFERDLDRLLAHFEPLELDDLLAVGKGERSLERPGFHLSFDDGLRSCWEVIAPLLEQRGVPATFFVNTSFIGNRDLSYRFMASALAHRIERVEAGDPGREAVRERFGWPRDEGLLRRVLRATADEKPLLVAGLNDLGEPLDRLLEREQPYMSEDELNGLQEKGFNIGSHGRHHQPFQEMSRGGMNEALQESFGDLEAMLGPGFRRVFSFPFSDDGIPKAELDALIQANELEGAFGSAGLKTGRTTRHFQRIPAEDPKRSLDALLRGEMMNARIRGLVPGK